MVAPSRRPATPTQRMTDCHVGGSSNHPVWPYWSLQVWYRVRCSSAEGLVTACPARTSAAVMAPTAAGPLACGLRVEGRELRVKVRDTRL
jgi:hypothetical protein